jgi:hypothetical protein
MNRQKFIVIYLLSFIFLSFLLYFGLKSYSQKNFSLAKLDILTDTVSKNRDITDDLCKYQILSEPKVADQYVKINFWCQNSRKSRSTLSLNAIKTPTIEGILKEYARIINFDYQLISKNQWYCLINDEEILSSSFSQIPKPASTIDCFENKSLYRYDQKEH